MAAKQKDKLNLACRLVPNTLPDTDGFHVVLTHVETTGPDTFYVRTAARRPGLTPETVRQVSDGMWSAAADIMADRQYRIVVQDGYTLELAVPGSTDSVDGTPTEPAYVAIHPANNLKAAADGVTPTLTDADERLTELRLVECLGTNRRSAVPCNGNGLFQLGGGNIAASRPGEAVKVIAADGTELLANVVEEDGTGHTIVVRLSGELPPGKGEVELTTRGWRTPEGEPMRLPRYQVTILADTPPTPTGDEPVLERGYSEGEGHSDGQVYPYYPFILQGEHLTDAEVKIGYSEGGTPREQVVPDEKLTVSDSVIRIASDSVELEDAIAAGGVVTFTVTTPNGSDSYEAEVQE